MRKRSWCNCVRRRNLSKRLTFLCFWFSWFPPVYTQKFYGGCYWWCGWRRNQCVWCSFWGLHCFDVIVFITCTQTLSFRVLISGQSFDWRPISLNASAYWEIWDAFPSKKVNSYWWSICQSEYSWLFSFHIWLWYLHSWKARLVPYNAQVS